MTVEIRRTLTQIQDTHVEGGFKLETPTKLVSAICIIKNPWFGRGYVENLTPEIREHGPVIGKLLTNMLLDVCGDKIEGCGKASIVGSGGELEHAQAMTHTLWFGNEFRGRGQRQELFGIHQHTWQHGHQPHDPLDAQGRWRLAQSLSNHPHQHP